MKYYHYTYSNGIQFLSLGNPLMLQVYADMDRTERPKCIGIWIVTPKIV